MLCSFVGTGVNCGFIICSLPENCSCGLTQGYTPAKYLTAAVFGINQHIKHGVLGPRAVCARVASGPWTQTCLRKHCKPPGTAARSLSRFSSNIRKCFPVWLIPSAETLRLGNCLNEGLGVSIFFFPSLLSRPPHRIPMWSAGIEAAAFSWQENAPSRMQLLLTLGHAHLVRG